MHGVASIIGSASALVAVVSAVVSVVYLRRQTQIMASQLDKAIEIRITKDLEAPEGVDTKLRTFLNRRLNDVRVQMRQEFQPQIEDINWLLNDSHLRERKDIAEVALRVLDDGKDLVEGAKESISKVSALEQQILELQQAVAGIRSGVGNQAMVRAQIREIAEQLLRMIGQEQSPYGTSARAAVPKRGDGEPSSDGYEVNSPFPPQGEGGRGDEDIYRSPSS